MNLGFALVIVSNIPSFFGLFCLLTGKDKAVTWGAYAIANWMAWLGNMLDRAIVAAAWSALLAVIFTYLWWKNRRNGRWKKALKALGEKSKVRVQALVRQMTPSPIPSPVGGES